MVSVTVDRARSNQTNQHRSQRRQFPSRLHADLLLNSLFGGAEEFPPWRLEPDASDMDREPTIFDSLFQPSLFAPMYDGIRPARQRITSPFSHHSFGNSKFGTEIDDRRPNSSNVRVIPIKVEHVPSNQDAAKKSPATRQTAPIILDEEKPDKSSMSSYSTTSKNSRSPRYTYKCLNQSTDSPPILIDDDIVDKVDSHQKKNSQSLSKTGVSQGLKFKCLNGDTETPITLDDVTVHVDDSPRTGSPKTSRQQENKTISTSPSSKRDHLKTVEKITETPSVGINTNANNNSSGRGYGHGSQSTSGRKLSSYDVENDGMDVDYLSPIESRNPSFSNLPASYSQECDLDLECEEKEVNPAPSYPIYDVLKVLLAEENRKIDYIRGDGNCFFRALSKQLYGTEKYHKAVRSLIVDIIATNKSAFEQFVDRENVQEHVERMSEDHSWATTCEIYAAATLLQRDLYMLTPDHTNEKYTWLLFKPVFTSTKPLYEGSQHPCYITMCNTNGNHYDRVVPDHGGCNCFSPHPELDGVTTNVDLT